MPLFDQPIPLLSLCLSVSLSRALSPCRFPEPELSLAAQQNVLGNITLYTKYSKVEQNDGNKMKLGPENFPLRIRTRISGSQRTVCSEQRETETETETERPV